MTNLVNLLTGLAWPALIAWFVWYFREPLRSRLTDSDFSLGSGGLKVSRQQNVLPSPATEEKRLKAENPGSALEKAMRSEIRGHLDKLKEEERETALVDTLATARLCIRFERIYGAIFGSQITALKQLQAHGGKVSILEAINFFEELRKTQAVLQGVTFADWLRFLTSFGLVSEDQGQITLTELGSDFLLWLSSPWATGLPQNKVG